MSRREWDDRNLTWQNVSDSLHETGFDNGLYDIVVQRQTESSNSNIIFINEPITLFPWNIAPNVTEKYVSFIVTTAKAIIEINGGTVDIDILTQDVRDIVDFEKEMLNVIIDFKDNYISSIVSIPLTIQHFQEQYDKQHPENQEKIDWYSTIKKVFASEGIAIEPSEKIIVNKITYFAKLVSLLKRTPSRTIGNYMQWTIYLHKINDLIIYSKLNRITNKTKIMCKESNLDVAICHEYVKKYLLPKTIHDIIQIITDVKSAVQNQIKHTTWMNEPTKGACIEKLAYIGHNIKSELYTNTSEVDKYHEKMNVGTTHIDTLLNLSIFKRRKMLSSLRTPSNETFSDFYTVDINLALGKNAYYSKYLNKFVIPLAYLQSSIYSGNFPFLSYGPLGFTIAHEISHAFHTFDGSGKYSNVDVQSWPQKNFEEFIKIPECFINHYNEYTFLESQHMNVSMNGNKTLKENIADSAGIAAAYYAYRNRKAKLNETEWRLLGLEQYNDDQIFFIMYAQTMCESFLPTELRHRTSDVHSANEIRVRGSLSNFPEFSAAYNCPVGTLMNPVKKCALWY
ncbi:neprilysin-like [Pseudomyrmex gracilis]|uniref:neprilysin-like n=1 Tax=Pseudomyrmex gracilis TaxID=219809 RepID=UPI000995768E|nr:neprilysin-like [Pseudomyrmex gracilis]